MTTFFSSVTPDTDRLWSDLMVMATIGATANGGCYRPALSDSDRDGRNLFLHWAREAGMTIKIDQIGNIFARRAGEDDTLPPVMMGSHLDTQTPGGKFDGVLGVLAGLAVVRAMNDAAIITRRPVEVAVWTNEEGVRFPGLMGSSVFAGLTSLQKALDSTDKLGVSVRSELSRTGFSGTEPVGGREIDSYLELHIEQGAIMEEKKAQIGAVTNSSWWAVGDVDIHGKNGHAQTAPMSHRRNALLGAAELIKLIEEIGRRYEPEGMVSVTELETLPNNMINLPHYCKMKFLIVHATEEGRAAIISEISNVLELISFSTQLTIKDNTVLSLDRLDFSKELIEMTEALSKQLGFTAIQLPTLTGHDALAMNTICPTAIIFVPCRNGISHSEEEWCEPEHVSAGAKVLLQSVLNRAEVLTEGREIGYL